jgi:pyruvate-formate lyase-activating enzyme
MFCRNGLLSNKPMNAISNTREAGGHCWVSYLLVPGVARLGREPFKYGNVWHKLFLAIGPLALHAFHPGSVKRLVLRTNY